MARVKIDYGIDLGTTNSAICRMEKGEPTIIKTDVLKDTMPSCISVNKKGSIGAGDSAYNTMKQDKRRATKSWKEGASNTYIEFKRTMGTDTKYPCSNLNKDFTSEELSAEVLKTLKSFVQDEEINSVVITVPAKFTVNQNSATLTAAKLAGFRKCELLQEPIAASMAYGISSEEKDGIWMVFDFGGGTFDAALLRVEDGIMQVFDTEGDNYLGGKNLDYAIVDKLIIPHIKENFSIEGYLEDDKKKEILRDALKTYAEDAKNELSFKDHSDIISNIGDLGEDEDGEELELDLTLTQEQVFDVMRPLFQKAVDICKDLLKRNNLTKDKLNKLILVGGPTHSPLIRQMLKEQITPNVDTSIDPMTAVATGAALYASTIDNVVSDTEIKKDTVKLELTYEATSVETIEFIPVKLPNDSSINEVFVELVRVDGGWSSGKIKIDKKGNVIETNLMTGPNSFTVNAYDEQGNKLPCFPSEITITQGTKVGAAPLSYNIGIEVWNEEKERGVIRSIKGLEKNKLYPAHGKIEDLRTTQQLRPNVKDDKLLVRVYQIDKPEEADGKTAYLYEYVADVLITGEDIEQLVPENSSVNLELYADAPGKMRLEVSFIASDQIIEKTLDTNKEQSIEDAEKQIRQYFRDANNNIRKLARNGINIDEVQAELDKVKEENENSSEKKAVLQHLKEVLRKIETLDSGTEWQRVEKEIKEEMARLEMAQEKFGDDQTNEQFEELRSQANKILANKDLKLSKDVLKGIENLYLHLTMVYQIMGIIQHYDDVFDMIEWKDENRARQLINKGLAEMNNQPTTESLLPIARGIMKLLPPSEQGKIDTGGLLK